MHRHTELLLCGFKLDPYLQSLRHWDLRKHGLTLLNSLLLHCFQPGGRQGADEGVHQSQENTAHKVLVTHMTRLLDGTVDDDKVRYMYCAYLAELPSQIHVYACTLYRCT